MKTLIMMLFNIAEQTYHPIIYFEHPFSGNDNDLYRFKSQGHKTTGFKEREDALTSIEIELIPWVRGRSTQIYKELDGDIPWDGKGIPADNQLRNEESLQKLLAS